jgi:hypothetical protein
MAHAQDTGTTLQWFDIASDKVFFIWLCGAILLWALAFYLKAE